MAMPATIIISITILVGVIRNPMPKALIGAIKAISE